MNICDAKDFELVRTLLRESRQGSGGRAAALLLHRSDNIHLMVCQCGVGHFAIKKYLRNKQSSGARAASRFLNGLVGDVPSLACIHQLGWNVASCTPVSLAGGCGALKRKSPVLSFQFALD
jgi:hypothetical protein